MSEFFAADLARLDERIDALRSRPAPDPAALEAFAQQRFSAGVDDEAVVATVTGAGELVDLTFTVLATRGEQAAGLGDRITTAINTAFAVATAARRAAFGVPSDPGGSAAEKADALAERMAGVADRLSGLAEQLSQQTAALRELR